ncbi:MAG: competence protein ComEA [Candidatus Rokuibacteriota bacterium]|nr:MAG: competence protein ComEA [Candidatus Rokubacteria bacterium]
MSRFRPVIVVLLIAFAWLVPWPAFAAPPSHTSETQVPVGAPVNINTADVKELMKLEGIGRRAAEKIVEYRDAHGPFKKPEELRKVDGVGSGLWERNRARIVIK